MNSEKVKEIKKALECCQGESLKSCESCPYWNFCKEDDVLTFKSDILILINEFESENDRYKQSCGAIGQNSLTIINQLKDRIAGLESENAIKSDTIVGLLKNQEFCEKEKLTKFAERLKEKLKEKVNADNVDAFVECSSMIRDLLREFVEE